MNDIEKAIAICRIKIGEKYGIADQDINEAINCALNFYPTIDKVYLRKRLMEIYSIRTEPYQILTGKDLRVHWLKDFKSKNGSDWKFWERYKSFLVTKEGYPPNIVQEIDRLTDDILDNTFNPNQEGKVIIKKGLVVGQVQSGKTANFTGLICKAADAGFNLIIVLAGILDDLRSQTQNRLDKGFLGFSTNDIKSILTSKDKIGVGFINDKAIAHSLTTRISDFKATTANSIGVNFMTQDPILLVIKKNGRILNNLYNWLDSKNIDSKSVLIIDDEADNAGVNISKDEYNPSSINRHIRNLIKKFKKVAYVGYTATPFANIFISQHEEDDLFPRHFIINIPTPENYIGPEKIFGISPIEDVNNEPEKILPLIQEIDDYTYFIPENHKIENADNLSYDLIPESLKRAIRCFILTCAIRNYRGQAMKHNSMLIHISRFQKWQKRIKELITEVVNYYRQEIISNDTAIFEEFRQTFEEDGDNYKSFKTISKEVLETPFENIKQDVAIHSWNDIKPLLIQVINKVEVKELNGQSKDSLCYENYPEGYYVIAIGGNKLSRGLTLEGLSISYFLRSSKMYDTLMQMGRWFGYRSGYVDLCRLFTSKELNSWFKQISIANDELRTEFQYLFESERTPEDYALKVRTSPGLLITSPLKMKSATDIHISWAKMLVETYALPRDKGSKNANLVLTDNFISSLNQHEITSSNDYLWRNISPEKVCDFLLKFKIDDEMKKKVNLDCIVNYIHNLVSNFQELTSWRIAMINVGNSKAVSNYTFSNGLKVNCGYRTRSSVSASNKDNVYYIKKNHILGSQKDEFVDLENECLSNGLNLLNAAYKKTKDLKGDEWKVNYASPAIVREYFRPMTNPLLILYPLNPWYSNVLIDPNDENSIKPNTIKYEKNDSPFIGFAIVFPNSKNKEGTLYRINVAEEYPDLLQSEKYFDNNDDNNYEK